MWLFVGLLELKASSLHNFHMNLFPHQTYTRVYIPQVLTLLIADVVP